MRILIESKDGTGRNEIDVDGYQEIGSNLLSLRTVLELVTRGILDMHYYEKREEAKEAALIEEAMQSTQEVRA